MLGDARRPHKLRSVCSKNGRDAILDEIKDTKENADDLEFVRKLLNVEIEEGITYPFAATMSKEDFLSCACSVCLAPA